MDRVAALARIREYEASVRPGPVTRLFRRVGTTRAFASIYRHVGPVVDPTVARFRDGEILARVYGFPTLLLTSTGARSGQPRVSPLLYVRDGDDVIVIGTNFGQAKHPGWTANLRAEPRGRILIGGVELPILSSEISEPEWSAIFPRFVAVYPGYANYLQRRRDLVPRMFRLAPAD